jgi:hypothetical protein
MNMDYTMSWRVSNQVKNIIYNMGVSRDRMGYWSRCLRAIDNNKVSAWDWQWYFSLSEQNQLTIFPRVNLVANIGFDNFATHTKTGFMASYVTTGTLEFPLVHPRALTPDTEFDRIFEKKNFGLKKRIVARLARVLAYFI